MGWTVPIYPEHIWISHDSTEFVEVRGYVERERQKKNTDILAGKTAWAKSFDKLRINFAHPTRLVLGKIAGIVITQTIAINSNSFNMPWLTMIIDKILSDITSQKVIGND